MRKEEGGEGKDSGDATPHTLVHRSCAHGRPPPCRTQNMVGLWADLVQPSTAHFLPPPWVQHRPEPPTADREQSGTWHRLPPPWAAQKSLSRAPFVHPSTVQRRPPPWRMQ
jgi:hypothetical protein